MWQQSLSVQLMELISTAGVAITHIARLHCVRIFLCSLASCRYYPMLSNAVNLFIIHVSDWIQHWSGLAELITRLTLAMPLSTNSNKCSAVSTQTWTFQQQLNLHTVQQNLKGQSALLLYKVFLWCIKVMDMWCLKILRNSGVDVDNKESVVAVDGSGS